jgi:hypothetical protein
LGRNWHRKPDVDLDRLLAWIEPAERGEFIASFVAERVPRRAPATRRCASKSEAERWVEDEASSVGAHVAWVCQPATTATPR